MTIAPVVALAVRGLTVRFGTVSAVDGLSLDVERGSIVGLVGPNGCGKTTTLRSVMGLVEPTVGDVRVSGFAAGTLAARQRAAWVPDEPTGLDELCVGELLELTGALYRADKGFGARCATLLAAFGLDARRTSRVGALSHGMRRIVACVAAVALEPELLVVDEATAALDPEAVIVLRETLRAVARRDTAVLIATQDLHFAEETCDRIALLNAGRLIADGSLPALRQSYGACSLEEAFVAAIGCTERLREVPHVLDAL